ncbi:hypothetical protein SLEP1_g16183 [Rubroshorea leprosula]|uniref:Uncharacterized protein n=1 Tax=Rubroshorea leprosula TaxID=152421 RepID=A0AAV5J1P2_9ROSI|nr:hypothetical protein SLEP1_g16183 [Rubroshorea leprosula]
MVSVPFLAADGDMSETTFLLTRASRLGVETLTKPIETNIKSVENLTQAGSKSGTVQQAESKSAQCSKQRASRHSAASREGSGTGSKSGTVQQAAKSKSGTVQQAAESKSDTSNKQQRTSPAQAASAETKFSSQQDELQQICRLQLTALTAAPGADL